MVGSALRDAFADLIGSVDPKVLRVAVNATFRSKLGQALEQSDGTGRPSPDHHLCGEVSGESRAGKLD
jgi:hypothetical protein